MWSQQGVIDETNWFFIALGFRLLGYLGIPEHKAAYVKDLMNRLLTADYEWENDGIIGMNLQIHVLISLKDLLAMKSYALFGLRVMNEWDSQKIRFFLSHPFRQVISIGEQKGRIGS